MRRTMTMMTVLLALVLAACGGDDSGDDATDTGTDDTVASGESNADDGGESSGDSDSSSGDVVDPQPPGQASVSVDGQEFMFDTLGPSDCNIGNDSLSFAFVIEETSATLGAGANLGDDGWQGDILLRVLDDDGRPVQYSPQKSEGLMIEGTVAVDGNSMSFSGPMEMQPPNDGTNPPPVEVGDGTISATCG